MFTRTYSGPLLWKAKSARFVVPASTVLVNSGPLTSGWYTLDLILSYEMDTPAPDKGLVCELRNNIDDYTVAELCRCEAGQTIGHVDNRFFIAQDERLRVRSLGVPGSPQSLALWQMRYVALPE
jgi:hypothetical protein